MFFSIFGLLDLVTGKNIFADLNLLRSAQFIL